MTNKIKILNYILTNLNVRAVSVRTAVWRIEELEIDELAKNKEIELYNEEIEECKEAIEYIEKHLKTKI